ncbi:MAG: hypothetical protein SOY06_04625 [Prevotella sp.]|nr:hypothetical protein [Bacteroidales bacterium]MDY4229114.1 hypothetical protein [Prevotella sp.]
MIWLFSEGQRKRAGGAAASKRGGLSLAGRRSLSGGEIVVSIRRRGRT